uniref:M48 family peptidase n=1 Tax=Fervidobacterium thailandense TaxID=1008305 RepID=A0A7C5RJ35_9BACT
MTPLEIVHYVVVHELAHLSIPNHRKEFWRRVAQIIPDYKHRRRWLKENGHKLYFLRDN